MESKCCLGGSTSVVSVVHKGRISVQQLVGRSVPRDRCSLRYPDPEGEVSERVGWQKVKNSYRVDHALLSREDMIVMQSPLPRVNGK